MEKQIKNLKLMAKESMKKEKYTEAFLHLTHALTSDPNNRDMLSDRCRCLMLSEQFNLALEDAEKVISLAPNSGLGYARKADIHFATYNFESALTEYQKAFQCNDSDKESCMEGINRCKKEILKDKNIDKQYPYVGGALGIFLSSVLLVLDYLSYQQESYLAHPVLKVLVVILSAATFYGCAILYRKSIKHMRRSLLEPPPDLFGDKHLHQD